MRVDSRLNLLLTPPRGTPRDGQPWHQTVSQLLIPMGVRTFEANSGAEAVELIERHPIHLAVVDTRLPAISGMNVLQLIQRLREQGQHLSMPPSPPPPEPPAEFRLHMQMEEQTKDGQRRIEVRIDAKVPAPRGSSFGPVVILIAPRPEEQDKQLLQEALKFNAFSVLSEPVDVNLALEVMARAMKRWFSGQWPA